MPSNSGKILKLVMEHGPKAVEWANLVADFIRKNPKLPEWAGKQLEDLAKRAKDLSKRRDAAAGIRKTLEAVREGARNLEAHEGGRPEAEAGSWIKRADNIELRVRLAVARPQPEQKKVLAQLRSETVTLLAELSDATARAGSATGSDATEDERAAT